MNDKNKYFYMICHKLFKLYELDTTPQSMWCISKDVCNYLISNKIFKFDFNKNDHYFYLCGIPVIMTSGTDIVKLMVELWLINVVKAACIVINMTVIIVVLT